MRSEGEWTGGKEHGREDREGSREARTRKENLKQQCLPLTLAVEGGKGGKAHWLWDSSFLWKHGQNPAQKRRKRESVVQRQLDLGSRGWVALAKGGCLRGKVAGLEQQERMTAVEEVKPGMGFPLGMTEQWEGEQH